MSKAIIVLLVASSSANKIQRLSQAQFEFTLDLYKELSHRNPLPENPSTEHNILFSPYSISTVLSMLYLAAGPSSETAQQLKNTLHYTNISFLQVHTAYRAIMETLNADYYKGVVEDANGVFIQNGFGVSNLYLRALQEFYSSALQTLDFKKQNAEAKDFINRWVSKKTHGNIPNLLTLPPTPDTSLMLINALYFKGKWLHPFDKTMTFDKGLFYVNSNERFEIPMMIGKFKLPLGYSPDLKCRILELAFSQNRISVFILLPDSIDSGLLSLERNITSKSIKALFSTLKEEVVNLRLPRFRIDKSTELLSSLKTLGLTDVFHPNLADLRGMSDSQQMFVSDLHHRCVFSITEEGAEGSSATSLALERVGSIEDKYFEADHPFIFFLWDYRAGLMLFVGRVVQPQPILEDDIDLATV